MTKDQKRHMAGTPGSMGGKFAPDRKNRANTVTLDASPADPDQHRMQKLCDLVVEEHRKAIRDRRDPHGSTWQKENAAERRDDYEQIMSRIETAGSFRQAADRIAADADERWDANTSAERSGYERRAALLQDIDPTWVEREDRELLAAGGLTVDDYQRDWTYRTDMRSAALYSAHGIDPDDTAAQDRLVTDTLHQLDEATRSRRNEIEQALDEFEENDYYDDDPERARHWVSGCRHDIDDLYDLSDKVARQRDRTGQGRGLVGGFTDHGGATANLASKLKAWHYPAGLSGPAESVARFGTYSPVGKPATDPEDEPF